MRLWHVFQPIVFTFLDAFDDLALYVAVSLLGCALVVCRRQTVTRVFLFEERSACATFLITRADRRKDTTSTNWLTIARV